MSILHYFHNYYDISEVPGEGAVLTIMAYMGKPLWFHYKLKYMKGYENLSLQVCKRSQKQGFWYFAENKAKFRGIFRSKFAEKSADFAGFSPEKSKTSRKNRPISRDFSGKKVNFRRIFRGKFLEKSADFTGNFGGKVRQETISKKQPISLDLFRQISLKSINFASIWPAFV